ncbi:serum amyloid P-component-like [Leptodactylus fuscus]
MREKLLAFPVESSTSYVRISPDRIDQYSEASICMRFHSNLTRQYSLFSMSTQSKVKAFALYYDPESNNEFLLSVSDSSQVYTLQGNDFTQWTSLCATWNSSVWGLFINGKYYKSDLVPNVRISGDPCIVIGQAQNKHCGGFNELESFVGEMTDINMWDKALTDENMMDYFADNEMSGNVINWKALNYTLHGEVTIKPYVDPYPCVEVI